MPYTRPTLDYVLRRLAALLALAAVSSCSSGDTVLLKVTADGPVDKFKIYIRNNVPDATGKKQFVFATPDWTDATKMGTVMINDGEHGIGVKLPGPGDYSIVLLGMKGRVTCLDPQHDDLAMPPGDGGLMEEYGSGVAYFWAATGSYMGNEELPARMFEVKHAAGMNEDQDCDSFPDVNTWPVRLGGQVATIPTTLLDCNDQKQAINPFAPEPCGAGVDQDCDGKLPPSMCADADGDGDPDDSDCASMDKAVHHPNAMDRYPELANCCGYSFNEADARAGRMPSHDARKSYAGMPECPMMETCGTRDLDCDGNVTACLRDQDCDRFYAAAQMDATCKAPANAPAGNDCNDCDAAVNPGATELCGDGKDNNCDGKTDEGCVSCDLDGDGYQRKDGICPEVDYKLPIDCNDDDRAVYEGAMAVKVPLDALGSNNACDPAKATNSLPCALRNFCGHNKGAAGDVDCALAIATAGCPPATAMVNGKAEKCDADGDGFISEAFKAQCDPMGKVPNYDCNDNDAWTFPGAPDRCGDSKAQNCDQDVPCASIADADKDGYEDKWDCDRGNKDIHPGAIDVCDGKDNDCDGLIDEDNPDPSGNPMGTLAGAKQCNNSGIGECKPQPGGRSGHCVCSVFSIKDYYFTDDASRVLCPGDASDATKNDKEGSSAPRCYFAQQPQPNEICDGKDTSCTGFDDLLPADHSSVETKTPGWMGRTYTLTDCPGPVDVMKNTFNPICCPPAPMSMDKAPSCRAAPGTDPDNCSNCNVICSNSNVARRTCGNGTCNGECADGWADCNGSKLADGCELNVANSADHCGVGGATGVMGGNGLPGLGCGVACSGAHIGNRSCIKGVCSGNCDAGYADCNGDKLKDGCEVNSAADVMNCGAGGATGNAGPNGLPGAGCGAVCSTQNGTPACAMGRCSISCKPGFGNCDGLVEASGINSNGCEANTLMDINNCGAGGGNNAGCGSVCSRQNGTPTCGNGACTISCNNGFANCNGMVGNNGANSDGCEVNALTDVNNCGAGGAMNTGCGVKCSTSGVLNNMARCQNGMCNADCAANFADCDGNKQTNGCEDNVASDPMNCGAGGGAGQGMAAGCGVVCSGNNVVLVNGKPRCQGGACNSDCLAGFADCKNGKQVDGCEDNVLTDPMNCGAGGGAGQGMAAGCGVVCSSNNIVMATCAGGVCNGTCTSGRADCNTNKQSDGCEVNTFSVGNCGPGGAVNGGRGAAAGCGCACTSQNGVAGCAMGTCTITCNAFFANCDNIVGSSCGGNQANGCETATNTAMNCGPGGNNQGAAAGCGCACATQNGTPACAGGSCTITCTAGFANCDNLVGNSCAGNQANGCETVTLNDPNNCGAGGGSNSAAPGCGCKCSAQNGTPGCAAGMCTIVCNAGFASCDGVVGNSCAANQANGCETDTRTSVSHCGGCNQACGATGDGCAAGACTCGGGAKCVAGQRCLGGQCVCDATSCAAGCCTAMVGGTCNVKGLGTCGNMGSMCVNCNAGGTLADSCNASGQCRCGAGAACAVGQRCQGGQCVCDGTSCPAGCCTTIVNGTCNAKAVATCGNMGSQCANCGAQSDTCNASGQCRCGGNAPCVAGQRCLGGACVCDGTSCPDGCCNGATCNPQVPATCGDNGGMCTNCGITADTCNGMGQCRCGGNAPCAAGQQCVGGVCQCNATSCSNGCCTQLVNGACQAGNQDAACGAGGVLCVACGVNAEGGKCVNIGGVNQCGCNGAGDCTNNINGNDCNGNKCDCNAANDCPGVPNPRSCNTMTGRCTTACGGGDNTDCNGGCCSAGQCVDGRANNTKCGDSGAACVDCTATSKMCNGSGGCT